MDWTETRALIEGISQSAERDLHALFGDDPAPRDAAGAAFRGYFENTASSDPAAGGSLWEQDFETVFRAALANEEPESGLGSLDFRYGESGVHAKLGTWWRDAAEEIRYERNTLRNQALRLALIPPDTVRSLADSILHSSGVAGRFSGDNWAEFINPVLRDTAHLLPEGFRVSQELALRSSFWERDPEWCRSFLDERKPTPPAPAPALRLPFWRRLLLWLMSAFAKQTAGGPGEAQQDHAAGAAPELPPFLPARSLPRCEESARKLSAWRQDCQDAAERLDLAADEFDRRLEWISVEADALKSRADDLAMPSMPIAGDWTARRSALEHEFAGVSAVIGMLCEDLPAERPPPLSHE